MSPRSYPAMRFGGLSAEGLDRQIENLPDIGKRVYFIRSPGLKRIRAKDFSERFMGIGIDVCHTAAGGQVVGAVQRSISASRADPVLRLLKQVCAFGRRFCPGVFFI